MISLEYLTGEKTCQKFHMEKMWKTLMRLDGLLYSIWRDSFVYSTQAARDTPIENISNNTLMMRVRAVSTALAEMKTWGIPGSVPAWLAGDFIADAPSRAVAASQVRRFIMGILHALDHAPIAGEDTLELRIALENDRTNLAIQRNGWRKNRQRHANQAIVEVLTQSLLTEHDRIMEISASVETYWNHYVSVYSQVSIAFDPLIGFYSWPSLSKDPQLLPRIIGGLTDIVLEEIDINIARGIIPASFATRIDPSLVEICYLHDLITLALSHWGLTQNPNGDDDVLWYVAGILFTPIKPSGCSQITRRIAQEVLMVRSQTNNFHL